MNIRVEYGPTPIRHIAVQCPECRNWFRGRDITDDDLTYDYNLYFAQFHCPVCDKDFAVHELGGLNASIEEVSYPDVYANCLERKEVWE